MVIKEDKIVEIKKVFIYFEVVWIVWKDFKKGMFLDVVVLFNLVRLYEIEFLDCVL